jgi:hypothetical protein
VAFHLMACNVKASVAIRERLNHMDIPAVGTTQAAGDFLTALFFRRLWQ